MKFTSFFSAVVLFSTAFFTQAADLTNKQVENWLNAFPVVEQWMTKNESKLKGDNIDFLNSIPDDVMNQAIKDIQNANLYYDFKKLVAPFQFTPEAFISTQVRVFQAFVGMNAPNEASNLTSELAKNLQQLEQSKDLSAEEKAMMKAQMESLMGMAAGMNPSKQNPDIKVVSQYQAQIKALLGY